MPTSAFTLKVLFLSNLHYLLVRLYYKCADYYYACLSVCWPLAHTQTKHFLCISATGESFPLVQIPLRRCLILTPL